MAKSSNLIAHLLIMRVICLSMRLPLPRICATPPSAPLIFIALRTIPPLQVPPHLAWYGEVLNAKDMHIRGCRVLLVPGHNLKKYQDRALEGKLYGFTKTRSLLHWLCVATDIINHAHGAHFLKLDRLHPNPPIGHKLLDLDPASTSSDIECPMLETDLGDRAHSDNEPIHVTVELPPVGSLLEIMLSLMMPITSPF
jgi:hypothetical protein